MRAKKNVEPYIKIPLELASSIQFRVLPYSAKALWVVLMLQHKGNNNGNINATLTELSKHGWNSSATISKNLKYLIAYGFLIETRRGGLKAGADKCCLYGFTHLPIIPNERLGIKGAQAIFAYRQVDVTKMVVEEKLSIQKMKRIDS